jgi:hypothetical protein
MQRRQLVELEDLPWWPRLFRDAATDYLATALRVTAGHTVVAPLLAAALTRSRTTRIVDLCSGGSGPWAALQPALRALGVDVTVRLTDKFPNVPALAAVAAATPGLEFETASVDALDVPARLAGFRTIFTAFHHFPPPHARAILAAAVRDSEGIAIVEAGSRTPGALAMMAVIPAAVWILTPLIRPFRWSRLFWTYLVPVIPLAIMFDGIVSCLRIYTADEMLEMAAGADRAGAFEWQAGLVRAPGAPIGVPYLIGVARASAAASPDGPRP